MKNCGDIPAILIFKFKDSMKFKIKKRRSLIYLFQNIKRTLHEFYDPYPLSLRIVNLIKWVVNEKINDDTIKILIFSN